MRSLRSPFLLALADVLISALVVAPLVVAYWRGTWQVVDAYLVPLVGDPLNGWLSLAFGITIHLVFALLQPLLGLAPLRPHATFLALSRAYTALFGIACVNCWRGIWKVLDHELGITPLADAGSFAAALLALALTRTVRNISAPPFVVAVDDALGYFKFPTAFRTKISLAENGRRQVETKDSEDPYQRYGRSVIARAGVASWCAVRYVADCVVSVVVIGSLVVVVWRGAWYLVDRLLFPEKPEWSAWGSLILGYSIAVFVFSLQVPAVALCARLKHGFLRLVTADTFIFLSFCGTVNVWRGVWNLLNIHLLPDFPLMSNWLTHVVGLLVLMLLHCSNSILVRGVWFDGEEEKGACVVFPVLYIRHYSKKQHMGANHGIPAEEEMQTIKQGDVVHPLMSNHHNKSSDIQSSHREKEEESAHVRRDSDSTPLTPDVTREIIIGRTT
ncbi:uncharacterized protein LOC124157484 [Ischnura elegans]|uniref:uncharacterized protein LOC124157484 n=1 Tax=Ischnura elegans TaxID=197161 RepID=UPI001ED8B87F|nr:uncharacterized protein LOC124157484 [Ischnura elegans]